MEWSNEDRDSIEVDESDLVSPEPLEMLSAVFRPLHTGKLTNGLFPTNWAAGL